MAHKKTPAARFSGIGDTSTKPRRAHVQTPDDACEQGLSEVDREIIGALTEFRDTLRARTPLESKYTVRQVIVVVPPPQLGPEDVKKARAQLGVSQPVFADFLGTSLSTVRSWEQGQKPPSPMARRILGLIASDPPYWKSRFGLMVEPRGGEQGELGGVATLSGMTGERPSNTLRPEHAEATAPPGVKKRHVPKVKG